ncbi:hypothetical protein [Nocardioides sp. B-3]|uniref:hypothetical protein n=1 Tax=Nocardioides sp. B-3 TaxID=2895565 RepID=UPI0021524E49|nr:hypothetical protein [Nocardioides sp. B-3]UUZ59756.1 hypothetical protein LP418_01160 [Nocardioides sp. B-3]
MILGLASALASAGLFGVAAVLRARAMRALPDGELGLLGFVRAALRSWPLLAVVGAYLAGFALHAVALYLLPLYLAQGVDLAVAAGDRGRLHDLAARAARTRAAGWPWWR